MKLIYQIIFAAAFLTVPALAEQSPLFVLKDQAFRKKISLNGPVSFNIENLVTHGRVSIYETKSPQVQLSGEIHGDIPGVLITLKEFEDQIFISVSEMAHLTSVVGSEYAMDTSAEMHLKIGIPQNLLKDLGVAASGDIHIRGPFKNRMAGTRKTRLKSYYGSIYSQVVGQLIDIEEPGRNLTLKKFFEAAPILNGKCSFIYSAQ